MNDELSHFFALFTFSVQLPLCCQFTILCIIKLLLEGLDFLLYQLHDFDLCVFSKSKKEYPNPGGKNVRLYPPKAADLRQSCKVRGKSFFSGRKSESDEMGRKKRAGSFQEIYGEILQSCEEAWSRMTSQDLGGEGTALFLHKRGV